MVQYYNLTKYSETEGLVGLIRVTSELSNYWFGYALLFILFIVIIFTMIKYNYNTNASLHFGALMTALMAIYFYVSGIVGNSLGVYIPVFIYIVTLINKIYSGN